MNPLVKWLQERQAERRLSDTAFADLLGIDRATWSVLKNGRRSPGMFTINKAVEAFPECRETIISLGHSVTLHNPARATVTPIA